MEPRGWKRCISVLVFGAAAFTGFAWGGHDPAAPIRLEYQRLRQSLIRTHQQQMDHLRHAYLSCLDELRLRQLEAQQLFGPERDFAYRVIAEERRWAHDRFHCRQSELLRTHHLALERLEHWYRDALRTIPTAAGSLLPSVPWPPVFEHFGVTTGRPETCPWNHRYPSGRWTGSSYGLGVISATVPPSVSSLGPGLYRSREVYRHLERRSSW